MDKYAQTSANMAIMPSLALYQRGLDQKAHYDFNFHNALIVAAALESGSTASKLRDYWLRIHLLIELEGNCANNRYTH